MPMLTQKDLLPDESIGAFGNIRVEVASRRSHCRIDI
jgi:hypothetical protein